MALFEEILIKKDLPEIELEKNEDQLAKSSEGEKQSPIRSDNEAEKEYAEEKSKQVDSVEVDLDSVQENMSVKKSDDEKSRKNSMSERDEDSNKKTNVIAEPEAKKVKAPTPECAESNEEKEETSIKTDKKQDNKSKNLRTKFCDNKNNIFSKLM